MQVWESGSSMWLRCSKVSQKAVDFRTREVSSTKLSRRHQIQTAAWGRSSGEQKSLRVNIRTEGRRRRTQYGRGAATQVILHNATVLTSTPLAREWDRPRISIWDTVFFLKKHLSTLYNPGTEGSTGYTGTNRKDWSLRVNGRRISKQLKTMGCRQHGTARAGFAGVRSASESPFHVLLEPWNSSTVSNKGPCIFTLLWVPQIT